MFDQLNQENSKFYTYFQYEKLEIIFTGLFSFIEIRYALNPSFFNLTSSKYGGQDQYVSWRAGKRAF